MPWRNRVNPFGEIEAVPERGTLLGNRGCLINAQRELVRPFQLKRWISCVLEFKGRRHPIMTPGLWTELFFLDEATALAAGHRACCECRRPAAREFLRRWNQANGQSLTRFPELDAALHEERLRRDPVPTDLLTIADGILFASEHKPYLFFAGCFFPWTPAGYGRPVPRPHNLQQLTPPSIAKALSAGYLALIHTSALSRR